MKLSAKAITTYNGVNSFSFGNQWSIRSGDPNTLYFQIIDLDQNGLRYMMGIGAGNQPATINVTFPSIDDDLVVTKSATQVDAADGSIWKIDLLDTDKPSGGNVLFALAEGSVTRRFAALQMVSVESTDDIGQC